MLGASGEKAAAEFLRSRGYAIVAHNFRCRGGEIDLIAMHGDTLVFVEVKVRLTRAYGTGIEAVGQRKRARMRKAAGEYLAFCGRQFKRLRFDIIAMTETSPAADMIHMRAAF